jgi:hypothetical protein
MALLSAREEAAIGFLPCGARQVWGVPVVSADLCTIDRLVAFVVVPVRATSM